MCSMPDREPDEARRDAGRQLLLVGVSWLCVVDAGWIDQAAHVADVGDVAVQLEAVDEPLAGLEAALDLEGEDRAGAAAAAYFCASSYHGLDSAGRRTRPTRPRRGPPASSATAGAFCDVPLHPQAQRLEALRDRNALNGDDGRAEVAQQLHAGLEDERQVGAERAADAEVAGVDQAVVARVGLGEVGKRLAAAA